MLKPTSTNDPTGKPIQGQKRRRDRRSRHPKPMRLTERDRDIIEAVHRLRVARQDQLQALFFGGRSATQRTLARLYDHGFLERKFLPVLYGRSPTLYVLDKRGADLLRSDLGYVDLVWYSSSKALKTEFLEHTAAINDFRIAITVAARKQGMGLACWLSESQLKADVVRVQVADARGKARTLPLVPDSYFVLDTPHGQAHFFLEVDRGTETIERFKQKVQAYVAYHASGGYKQRYGTNSLRILTIVTGRGRLANLRAAAKQVTEGFGGQRRFWFGLASQMSAAQVLKGPVWFITGEEFARGLFEPSPSP